MILAGASFAQSYIDTGHTGAQTQIDTNHTSSWTLSPSANTTLAGAYLTMKDGSATTANVTLSVYDGPTAASPLLASVTQTHSDFCTGLTLCGQFVYHTFTFAVPPSLVSGNTYFVALTSNAADTQNEAYFIKNGGTATLTGSVPPPAAPLLTKTFGSATAPLNSSRSLTLTITNPNTSSLTGIAVNDTLPSGMTFASPTGLANTCGGTATATGGVLSLSAGTLSAGASCTVSVNILVTTAGSKTNTTDAITSTEGGTGSTASASITGIAAPTITKAFSTSSTFVNTPVTMTLTISNSNATSLTGLAVTDALPTGMVLASPANLQNTCGGIPAANAGTVSLAGGTLAANSSCTVRVNVMVTSATSVTNTTGAVSSTEGGSGSTASATLSAIVGTPTLSEWGLIGLMALLAAFGGSQLKAHRA